jgi:hypothetical protein
MPGNQKLRNLLSPTIFRARKAGLPPQRAQHWRLLWSAAAVAMIILAIAVLPVWAQSAVPRTAREAAASPAFAPRLHPSATPQRPAPARPQNRRASPQDEVLYQNGPSTGICDIQQCTVDAWTITFGYTVTNQFILPSSSTITSFNFAFWLFPGDTLSSVDWSLGTTAFGNDIASGTASGSSLSQQFISSNQYGYNIQAVSITGLNVAVNPGYYWVTLANTAVPNGDPVYWDENNGPSQAQENSIGTIPSESFNVSGLPQEVLPCFSSGENMQIIHDFSGKGDGSNPYEGVVSDAAGHVYGAMNTGDTGYGMVYEIASKAGSWLFNILYSFTGGSDGEYPSMPIVGPKGVLYGTAGGGNYGLVYSLRPAPTACRTSLCSWIENVPYQFADGASAGNIAAFDQEGNLYGFSGSGGRYGEGAVFELTPLPTGWTETILYSFTGGSDGQTPNSLVVGPDGNLYGTGAGDAYPYGMVFQLVRPPSGGNWTENVIYSFTGGQNASNPYSLVQDGVGNLLGIYGYGRPEEQHLVIFMLSPSNGRWVFSVSMDINSEGNLWSDSDLATDAAGNVYWAYGFWDPVCLGGNCSLPDNHAGGYVFMKPASGNWHVLWLTPGDQGERFFPVGALGVDAKGNVYGTTKNCGQYDLGTIWKVTQ